MLRIEARDVRELHFALHTLQIQLFQFLHPWKKETVELRRKVKFQNGDLHKLRVDFGRIKDVSGLLKTHFTYNVPLQVSND